MIRASLVVIARSPSIIQNWYVEIFRFFIIFVRKISSNTDCEPGQIDDMTKMSIVDTLKKKLQNKMKNKKINLINKCNDFKSIFIVKKYLLRYNFDCNTALISN